MNFFIMLVWMGFWYCFVSDVFSRSFAERPDRWPGYRLGYRRGTQGSQVHLPA
ncbi:MAG: hypothetical protein J0I12_19320 [Candidatus Eremiobacteraeota bacterium]|nr:hypothetical protein [Candidatus Eremiobacteraeota bacterium]